MINVNEFTFTDLIESSEERLFVCREELSHLPEGFLSVGKDTKGSDHPESFRYYTINDGVRRYRTVNADDPIVYSVARKKFLQKEISILKSNLDILRGVESQYTTPSPINIINSLSRVYGNMPENYFMPNFSKENHEWMQADYERDMSYANNNVVPTSLGIKVKSKSERDILEALLELGIPVRYEEVLYINGHKIAPDFTTLSLRDGSLHYWEHCGMMGDPNYRRNHRWKVDQYEKVGIYPGKNLILTYEGDGHFLSPAEIREIIKSKLM